MPKQQIVISAQGPHCLQGRSLLNRRLRREGGFNLIEVTLAVALVAVGLLAIFGMLGGGIEASRRVAEHTIISQIVDDLISERRGTPYTNTTLLGIGSLAVTKTYTNFFTVEGLTVTNTTGQTPFFRILTAVKAPTGAPNTAGRAVLVMTATWPLKAVSPYAPVSDKTDRVFIAQIARRE